ncbi:MAG TPA: hypothetical protein VK487_06910 [Candidatus Bathyarchaeia archaeon]|nr:hypothetical protein [Candidatus Bathyarchaeia archaeon]
MPILKPGEEVLAGENTKFYNTHGYLSLTNKRLIFEYKPHRFEERSYTSVDMELEGISDVFVEGAVRKKLVVIARTGSFGKDVSGRLEFSVRDPYSWQRRLIEIRKSIPDTQTDMPSAGWLCPVCATLNLSDLLLCSRCGNPKPR